MQRLMGAGECYKNENKRTLHIFSYDMVLYAGYVLKKDMKITSSCHFHVSNDMISTCFSAFILITILCENEVYFLVSVAILDDFRIKSCRIEFL